VTGYVVAGSGSFALAFVVVGALLVVGAILSMFCTRRPIGLVTTANQAVA
jgi:ACS family glucarate transporter-like MFS transporter